MRASCQCGQLRAEVPGPTVTVVACHCHACQKRSGSPFGEAAYWPHDDVVIEGEAKQFDRPTDLGGVFSQFFCPRCGTTVFMRGTKNPTMTGVPIGLFDDPHAMQPIRSVWEDYRHPWVEISTAVQHLRARGSTNPLNQTPPDHTIQPLSTEPPAPKAVCRQTTQLLTFPPTPPIK